MNFTIHHHLHQNRDFKEANRLSSTLLWRKQTPSRQKSENSKTRLFSTDRKGSREPVHVREQLVHDALNATGTPFGQESAQQVSE